jgi:hypothetical protein
MAHLLSTKTQTPNPNLLRGGGVRPPTVRPWWRLARGRWREGEPDWILRRTPGISAAAVGPVRRRWRSRNATAGCSQEAPGNPESLLPLRRAGPALRSRQPIRGAHLDASCAGRPGRGDPTTLGLPWASDPAAVSIRRARRASGHGNESLRRAKPAGGVVRFAACL